MGPYNRLSVFAGVHSSLLPNSSFLNSKQRVKQITSFQSFRRKRDLSPLLLLADTAWNNLIELNDLKQDWNKTHTFFLFYIRSEFVKIHRYV